MKRNSRNRHSLNHFSKEKGKKESKFKIGQLGKRSAISPEG